MVPLAAVPPAVKVPIEPTDVVPIEAAVLLFRRPPLTKFNALVSLVNVRPTATRFNELSMYPPDVPMEGTVPATVIRIFCAD